MLCSFFSEAIVGRSSARFKLKFMKMSIILCLNNLKKKYEKGVTLFCEYVKVITGQNELFVSYSGTSY